MQDPTPVGTRDPGRRALTLGVALVPLLGVAGARVFLEVDVRDMTHDVTGIAGIHPLSGILSSLGVLLWWASGAVWCFSAALLRDWSADSGVGFMISLGALSGYLALDDLFQIHERLAPRYLGVSENIVYVIIGSALAWCLWRYRRLVIGPAGRLMAVALGFLGLSVVVDTLLEPWLWRLGDWVFFVEDGAKWLGIVFWTAFGFVWCRERLGARDAGTTR